MSEKNIKVMLDIGNERIKAICGFVSDDFQKMEVLAFVDKKSHGIKKSKIIEPTTLAGDIKATIDAIQVKIGREIENVSIAIGGPDIRSETVFNEISFDDKIITEEDMELFLEKAKLNIFGEKDLDKYRILYIETYNMKINNGNIIKNAIGKEGKSLQAQVHIVYMEEAKVEKYLEVLNRIGLEVDNIYLNSYMASCGTLDETMTQMGVVLVDIGYETTDIILIKNGKALYASSLPVGEYNFASDIHYLLDIDMRDSFKLFKDYKNKFKVDDENIENTKLLCGSKSVVIKEIKKIVDERTGDISKFIKDSIDESGFNGILKDLVFTGGGVEIPGIVEKISKNCGYTAKTQLPIKLGGLSQSHYNMSVAVGTFIYEFYREYQELMQNKTKKKVSNSKKEESDAELQQILDGSAEENKEVKESKIKNFFKIFKLFV